MAKKRLDPGPFVLPMPVALVGARVAGQPNFMTAAFVGIVNFQPAMVAMGLSADHYTCQGIEQEKTFSINLPCAEQVAITDYCGLKSGRKVSKAGLFKTVYGELGSAPMIENCRFSCECKLVSATPLGVDKLYVGEVVGVYVDESCLVGKEPDWEKIDPLLFTFPDKAYRKLGGFVARAWSVGKDFRP